MTGDSMHRRSFVKLAGAAAATVMLAPNEVMSAMRDDARPIRKAVKYGMVNAEGSMAERFALLKRLGYDGVELSSPNGFDRDEVVRARDAADLPIHGVVNSTHWSKPFSHPDPNVRAEGRRDFETALHDAKAYGATSVLLVPAVVNQGVAYDDAYERSQAEIRKVLPLAEELKIHILIENVWNNFLLSPMEAARYIDEFESEWIGWYFDVGNIVNYGWPEQWIKILGSRIIKLDIKEFSRGKRNDEGLWKGFGVKLLEGDCGWPAVMKALDEIGYEGWATAELGGGDEAYLRDVAERMDRIIAS